LFIVLTLNEWDEVAIVLGKQFPNAVVFPAAMLYILITAFTMVSLITGLITEKLIVVEKGEVELRLEDIKDEEHEQLERIKELLHKADTSQDGNLTAEEVLQALEDDEALRDRLDALEIPVERKTLKPIVDEIARQDKDCADDDGASIDKLAKQLLSVKATARSSEMFLIETEVSKLKDRLATMGEKVERLALQGANPAEQETIRKSSSVRKALLQRAQMLASSSSGGSRPLSRRGSHSSLRSTDRMRMRLESADARSRSVQGA